jgi:hypothetical protein
VTAAAPALPGEGVIGWHALRLGLAAGILLVVGLLLSGPLGLWLVNAVAPQPPWTGPAAFIEHYHPVQALPFFFGFVLVAGFPALHVAIFLTARPAARPLALLGLVFAAAFAALIGLNYIAQTTIVPGAVHAGDGAARGTVALFTMANPSSAGWALEMYGYAVLGLASLCVAPAFAGDALEQAARALLVVNGAMSVAGAALTSHDVRWVMTPAGLWAFGLWNVVILATTVVIVAVFRRRRARWTRREEGA